MARTDSIYWDEETKRLAQMLADEDHRSMSQEIAWLVHREYESRREMRGEAEAVEACV